MKYPFSPRFNKPQNGLSDPTTWIGVSRHFNYPGNIQVNKHSIQFAKANSWTTNLQGDGVKVKKGSQ